MTVIGATDDRIHIRLHPGRLGEKDPDDRIPAAPGPPGERDMFTAIQPPLRGDGAKLPGRGFAFALRDGGHGVPHLALTPDAWTDVQPRDVGHEALSEADREAVAAWRTRAGPTVGADVDLDLAPLWTFRLSPPHQPELWGVVKLLRWEILRVHLALFAERWPTRPESVRPWALSHRIIGGDGEGVSIGHFPLASNAYGAAKPQFAGVWTLEREELTGYETWRAAKGGTFTSLEPVLQAGSRVPSGGAEVVERQTREP